jgi:exonuclease SbcD
VDEQLQKLVEYGGAHIDRNALREDDWDYIALGHYHNATRVASNLWYAGATERTATNIWAEADTRKGWVLYDTETREGEFRDVATREVVDLPRFSARRQGEEWLTPEEIDGRIRDAVAAIPGGVAGKVVRLVVTDIPRELFRQLDHGQIRALKAEALHFQLDARRPEVRRRPALEDARRRTLEEEVELFLAEWEPNTPGIDGERLITLGAAYLAATEDWRETELELFDDAGDPDSADEADSAAGEASS